MGALVRQLAAGAVKCPEVTDLLSKDHYFRRDPESKQSCFGKLGNEREKLNA